MDRRTVLKLGMAQAAVAAFPKGAFATQEVSVVRSGPSVLQGATDSTKTQFSILYDRNTSLSFVVYDNLERAIFPDSVETITHGTHQLQLSKPKFSGLTPGTDFLLHVIDANSKTILDARSFRALENEADKLSFAVCSCMKHTNHEPKIWQDLVAQDPDVILFVGDSVYADMDLITGANPDQLWNRFCEARQTLEIYFSRKLIPILATWDDHDFGQNDTGMEYRYSAESLRNFSNFFAQDEKYCDYLERGPGISNCLTLRGHKFFLLDSRTYRKKGARLDRYGHWGQEQEEWMLQRIDEQARFVWIANGSQFFPTFPWKEGVARNHPANLEGLLAELKKKRTKAAFLSGDVHFSEISRVEKYRLGYESIEITSSPVHSGPGYPMFIPNHLRLRSSGTHNYVLVSCELAPNNLKAAVVSRGADSAIRFSYQFEIST